MKTFYLTVKDTITGEIREVPVTEEVYRVYMRPKWAEAKQRQRAHHCRLSNGKRCYGNCNNCKHAPAESFSFEKILEDGIPKDELKKGVTLPSTDGDVADQIIHNNLIANLLDLVEGLPEDERIIVEDFMAKVAEVKTAEKIGYCQKSVNNKKRKLFEKLRKILTENNF